MTEPIKLYTPEEIAKANATLKETERKQFLVIALLVGLALAILYFIWHQNVVIDSIFDRLYEIEQAQHPEWRE